MGGIRTDPEDCGVSLKEESNARTDDLCEEKKAMIFRRWFRVRDEKKLTYTALQLMPLGLVFGSGLVNGVGLVHLLPMTSNDFPGTLFFSGSICYD
ncbi:hypothetical protein VTJ04DRAFT_1010 [Mycothermus thermophilus]|uniref:uncharacterized protein n=1 Tax=Humicola insolens TaxID=85995 RepID=UPI003742225C